MRPETGRGKGKRESPWETHVPNQRKMAVARCRARSNRRRLGRACSAERRVCSICAPESSAGATARHRERFPFRWHLLKPQGEGAIYLCQHAVRSKGMLRNGAAEVAGGFVAWERAGLPIVQTS